MLMAISSRNEACWSRHADAQHSMNSREVPGCKFLLPQKFLHRLKGFLTVLVSTSSKAVDSKFLLQSRDAPALLHQLSVCTSPCLHITGDISIVLSWQLFKSLWKQL